MAERTKTSKTEWEITQLVRTRLFPDEDAVLCSALRALFQAQPEVRRQMLIRAYTAGEISIDRAASNSRNPFGLPLPSQPHRSHQSCAQVVKAF